ncbi:hypothetical protein MMPV_009409 [Pyropia vietnamensis]
MTTNPMGSSAGADATARPPATKKMRRAGGFCATNEVPGLGSAKLPSASTVKASELASLLDLLYAKAGVNEDATETEVAALLGADGYNLVTRLSGALAVAAQPPSESLDVSDVGLSSDDDGCVPSAQDDRSVPSSPGRIDDDAISIERDLCTVPDVAPEPVDVTLPAVHVPMVPDVTRRVPEMLTTAAEPVAYKAETEIALSRIFELGKVAKVAHPEISPMAPYDGPDVVTMTGFGELGRFGNQVLQYAFLRCYAAKHGNLEIQVPAWVGASLFGLKNPEVYRPFPAVVESRDTKANSTFTSDFIDYIKASNAGMDVPELPECVLDADQPRPAANVDVWGWFQWHTRAYAPYKTLIQNTFTPVPTVAEPLRTAFDKSLRFRGGVKRTVVGLHLRLGDYKTIAASSFGYCAPTSWYLEWLAKVWPTLENPVLCVASDDLEAVLRDFAEYNPITSEAAGLEMPESFRGKGAGFFPDWYMLTQCDVLAISNSTFSFTACMANKRPGARFFRAHYLHRMEEIAPWNADPIVHRDVSALSTLQVLYNTQGAAALARNVLYELPYYGVRSVLMKGVLGMRAARAKAVAAM